MMKASISLIQAEGFLKKAAAWLLAVIFLLRCCPARAKEPESFTPATGFDFSVTACLDPQALSAEDPLAVLGWADLLDALRLEGRILLAEDGDGLQIDASLIPVSRPEAAIPFRLAGIPTHLVLTSPLLGDVKIFFNNAALIDFGLKAYQHFQLPLPIVTTFLPLCLRMAWYGVQSAWDKAIGPVGQSCDLSSEAFEAFAEALSALYSEDHDLRSWLASLLCLSTDRDALQLLLDRIPDYWINTLIQKRTVHVDVAADGSQTWRLQEGEVFYQYTRLKEGFSARTALPQADNGCQPAFSCAVRPDPAAEKGTFSLELRETGSAASLDLKAEAEWPLLWPVQGEFSGLLRQQGTMFPSFGWSFRLTAEESGSFVLSVMNESAAGQASRDASDPAAASSGNTSAENKSPDTQEWLRVSGYCTPLSGQRIPQYTAGWAMQYINIFSVNESNMHQLIPNFTEEMIRHWLSFLAEIPASSWQQLLDDLSNRGIIGLLTGE